VLLLLSGLQCFLAGLISEMVRFCTMRAADDYSVKRILYSGEQSR
jgi:hypothetical protein